MFKKLIYILIHYCSLRATRCPPSPKIGETLPACPAFPAFPARPAYPACPALPESLRWLREGGS